MEKRNLFTTEDEKVSKKYRKHKGNVFFTVLKISLFVLLAYTAVKLGTFGGNFLSGSDRGIIASVDTQTFKSALISSLPIIDTVYNSGNVSVSLTGEIKSLINSVFDFDLGHPLTILNAQSPFFYSYYNNDYQKLLAQQEKDKEQIPKDKEDNTPKPDKDSAPGKTAPRATPAGLPEDASSISTDDSSEDRSYSDGNNISYGKITIQNQTKFKIDIDKLLKEPLKIKFSKTGPKALIYHTHTSEGYLKNASQINVASVASHTDDTRYSVVRVGDDLTKLLRKKYDISVIHNGTVNDYDYNNSYRNALNTVNSVLKGNPSIKVVLDVHRDGLGSDSKKLRAVAKVDGKNVARIMFVVGTNASGLKHPQWEENLKLALKLQDELNRIAPGITKPIYLSKNRYNQHVTNSALIVEVGGNGNLIDECLQSTKYLARAVSTVLNKIK